LDGFLISSTCVSFNFLGKLFLNFSPIVWIFLFQLLSIWGTSSAVPSFCIWDTTSSFSDNYECFFLSNAYCNKCIRRMVCFQLACQGISHQNVLPRQVFIFVLKI
jgi:hypothetical protein